MPEKTDAEIVLRHRVIALPYQMDALIDKANQHTVAMKDMTEAQILTYVENLITASDIVLGLFHDEKAQGGITVYIVKGFGEMQAMLKTGEPSLVRIEALVFDNLEQAVVACEKWGDKPSQPN